MTGPDINSATLQETSLRRRVMLALSLALGMFALVGVLAYHNLADSDLWARLVAGAHVWKHHAVAQRDFLAYTPILEAWVDHEWGAGLVFCTAILWFGPTALMILKMALALVAIGTAMTVAYRRCRSMHAVIAVAVPCAIALLPGYVPVVRSHAFTYALFALILLCLESMRADARWPVAVLPIIFVFWTNVHGGFASGLGIFGIYAAWALYRRQHLQRWILAGLLSLAATLINPYGLRFWQYLLPALLHERPTITEWQPLPLFAWDPFIGFRLLSAIFIPIVIVASTRRRETRDPVRLVILALTAYLGWRHRRHAPFFAVAAAAFAPEYLLSLAAGLGAGFSAPRRRAVAEWVTLGLCVTSAAWVAVRYLPEASLQVLAPVGSYPVREVDILRRSKAKGNLVVPFRWGSYAAWRLHPEVRVSIDGRYEETFPESTFTYNHLFFRKQGDNWARLVEEYHADFVILESTYTRITPTDLAALGFYPVWQDTDSALYATRRWMADLTATARSLPDHTVDPLARDFVRHWCRELGAPPD